jgi:predicted type IV restriction endonuclease
MNKRTLSPRLRPQPLIGSHTGQSEGGTVIETLIEKIQHRLQNCSYPNEAAISFSVVMPMLRALGWDDSDPEQVMPEYANGGRRVDFALSGIGKRPSIFIEVKGVGRALEGDRQLFEYAFHEGIPLCLLTDGRDWSFYLPSGQGTYDERRLYRLQLTERPPAESAQVLRRYLEQSRVKSGAAFDDAMRDYRDIASTREAARNLPKAWAELVEQPEDLLVELLASQTETNCGFRPSAEEVIAFLRSLKQTEQLKGPPSSKPAKVAVVKSDPPSSKIPELSASQVSELQSARALTFELFGKQQASPHAAAALVDILQAIARRFPTEMEAIADSAKGRSRNHIARSPEEIYPARPDLARAAEIAPGWLVGLNIANREKMRIIREACRVTGLTFGVDVKIEMPNADA